MNKLILILLIPFSALSPSLLTNPSSSKINPALDLLAFCTATLGITAVGVATISNIEKQHHRIINEQPLDLGQPNWLEKLYSAVWSWLTNREKRVTKLTKKLTDKLDQRVIDHTTLDTLELPLADVMITKKATSIFPFNEFIPTMLGRKRPEFFYGYPEVAKRVIDYATFNAMKTPSLTEYPDVIPPKRSRVNEVSLHPTCYAPALLIALRWDENMLAQYLLHKGAISTQECDFNGMTSLHYACAYQDPYMLHQLFVNEKNLKKTVQSTELAFIPIEIANLIVEYTYPTLNINHQTSTIHYGIEQRLKGLTPLYIAAVSGSYATLQECIRHKPNPQIRTVIQHLGRDHTYSDVEAIEHNPLDALKCSLSTRKPSSDDIAKLQLLEEYTQQYVKYSP